MRTAADIEADYHREYERIEAEYRRECRRIDRRGWLIGVPLCAATVVAAALVMKLLGW